MEVGVSVLPKLPMHAGDRNRTSPFAFTGNKFEFRAVGSSFSIAGPNTVLNTIVAESLDHIASRLEKSKSEGKDLNKAIQDLLTELINESKHVLFLGDNYTPEWHAEAEKRGLPNLKTTPEALKVVLEKETIALFTKYKVYSERELQSRSMILCENYIKTVTIEARCASLMAKTMILPAALRYQSEVAGSIQALQGAGTKVPARQTELLNRLSTAIDGLQAACDKLDHALAHHSEGDALAHTVYIRDHIITAMSDLRKQGDNLESMVADDLWPLPTYREMLFIK